MKTFLQFLAEKTFISTWTENKLAVIGKENSFIKGFIPSRNENEQVVGVVGDAKTGLKRHINQYVDLGYNPKNIYIFELLRQEYQNLLYHNSLLQNKINIIKGDIFKPRILASKSNLNVDFVTHADVDITSGLPSSLTNEINQKLKAYPNLNSLVLVHTSRSQILHTRMNFNQNEVFNKLFEFAKILYGKNGPVYISSLRNIIEYFVHGSTGKTVIFEEVFNSFPQHSFLVQAYRGKGPMVSITMVKTTGKRVVQSNIEGIGRDDIYRFKALYNNWLTYNLKDLTPYMDITKKQFTDINNLLAVLEVDVVDKLRQRKS
jgi:hypothetical protein